MFNSLNVRKRSGLNSQSVFIEKKRGIFGGVSVSTGGLRQAVVFAGTPIGSDGDNLYHIVKTGITIANAERGACQIKIAKGHNFEAGDMLALENENSMLFVVSSINEEAADGDILNLNGGLPDEILAQSIVFEAKPSGSEIEFAYPPCGLVGTSFLCDGASYSFTDCIVSGVAREKFCPPMSARLKKHLAEIKFV